MPKLDPEVDRAEIRKSCTLHSDPFQIRLGATARTIVLVFGRGAASGDKLSGHQHTLRYALAKGSGKKKE